MVIGQLSRSARMGGIDISCKIGDLSMVGLKGRKLMKPWCSAISIRFRVEIWFVLMHTIGLHLADSDRFSSAYSIDAKKSSYARPRRSLCRILSKNKQTVRYGFGCFLVELVALVSV